jgi:hypothetical protein
MNAAPGRDHLVKGGRHYPGIPGRHYPVTDGRLRRNRHARATLIEEGVATWIFGQAAALNLFADVKAGELPFDMLKHVRQFVAGYEAEELPLWLWEEAILQGYAAFRFLREHRRGRLHIDMSNRRLTIETLP